MHRAALPLAACLLALGAGLYVAGMWGGDAPREPGEGAAPERALEAEQDPVLLAARAPAQGPGTQAPSTASAASPSQASPSPASTPPASGSATHVAGQVFDEQGRPLVGATVRAVGAPTGTAEARTDGEGRFSLELPAPGDFPLSVSAPDREEIVLSALTLEGSRRVLLGHRPTLAGLVLDEATQAPLAGVLLTARPAAAPGAPQGASTQSRDDGSFVLELPAKGAYAIEAGGAGYAGAAGSEEYLPRVLLDVDAGRADLRIVLTRGLTIEGRVLSDAGEPLRREMLAEVLGRLANGDPDFTRRRRVRLSDGLLRVPGLAPGRYDLSVRPITLAGDPDLTDVAATLVRDVEAGTTGLEVRLARGAVLQGRLEDDAGQLVLSKGWVRALREGETRRDLAVMVDAPGDGTFRLGPLEANVRYDLEAGGFGVLRSGRTRGVAPGDARVVIVLSRGARIAGRVLDADGKPVPRGVSVGAFASEGSLEQPGRRMFASTGEDGRFVLGGLPDLPFEVQAGGGLSGYLGEQASDVKPNTEDLVLHVSPGVRLVGTLVDAQGKPVATTSLGANDGAHRAAMHPYAQVGPDGRFTLSGLQPGPVELYLMRGGAIVALGKVTAPGADLQVLVPAE